MTGDALGKAHVPWGSDGEGVYSATTLGCFSVIDSASAFVIQGAEMVGMTAKGSARRVVRIADYGTADGGTSLGLIGRVITALRAHVPTLDIEVCYEDQPNNDWRSLFYHAEGLRPITGLGQNALTAYTKQHERVYVYACGRSFHVQCFPPASVDVGMSFTAMHWLSKKPCNITNGVHSTQATGEERESFAKQAAEDWSAILTARVAELAPGGRLVIANFAVSPTNEWLGHTKEVKACMYSTFASIWNDMAKEGLITEAERNDATFINYYRTEAELVQPFQEGGALSSKESSGVELVSMEFRKTPCPFRKAWLDFASEQKSNNEEAARKHAAWYIPTLRTWSNSTFLTALNESRSMEERQSLVDELYKRYEDLVAQDPAAHGMDYVHAFMVIDKKM